MHFILGNEFLHGIFRPQWESGLVVEIFGTYQ